MNTTTTATTRFTIDFLAKKIYGSKASFDKAGLGYGPAYEELTAKMSAHPDFTLEVREQKHHITRAKRTYEGLDFKFMETYIGLQKNHENLLREYHSVKKTADEAHLSKYPLTKKWFLRKFSTDEEPFDMENAKEEISNHALELAKANANNDKSNAFTLNNQTSMAG